MATVTIKQKLILFFTVLIFFSSCTKENIQQTSVMDSEMQSLEVRSSYGTEYYALTNDQNLVTYNTQTGAREVCIVPINGLMGEEKLQAIDFRPATGQLYGVTNQNRLYTIYPKTGKAVAISMTPFTPANNGDMVGFDFNPTVDRIRLVTSNDQNLRLHPETGVVAATDITINPANNMITAVAYTNSFSGATTTSLYNIGIKSGKLYLQSNPNGGVIMEIGSLGETFIGEGGFDISSDNTMAIAALTVQGDGFSPNRSSLYHINIATGQIVSKLPSRRHIIGIAIPTTPVAYAATSSNLLLTFNPLKKTDILQKPITGLVAGEKIVGMDIRPANGQLYVMVNTSKLYVINTANGAATVVSSTPFTTLLHGTSFGFDFNPTVDRIRIVSNTGQNLRVHPGTGAVAVVDGSLNPGNPHVDAVAYTNSFAGATTTTLYDIDTKLDLLYKQDPPNSGTLVRHGGGIGIDGGVYNGFDIGGYTNIGYGIFDRYGKSYLFTMNLAAGNFEMIRNINHQLSGFTVGLSL